MEEETSRISEGVEDEDYVDEFVEDDEATMDEEEALMDDAVRDNELSELAAEREISIEELRQMYNYADPSVEDFEICRGNEDEKEGEEVAQESQSDPPSSDRNEEVGIADIYLAANDDGEDDADYVPKSIYKVRIDPVQYQADVPEYTKRERSPDDSPNYGEMLWSREGQLAHGITEENIADYVVSWLVLNKGGSAPEPDKKKAKLDLLKRDYDYTLYALLRANFNTEAALATHQNPPFHPNDPRLTQPPVWTPFTEEEIEAFEEGLLYPVKFLAIKDTYMMRGKDFFAISAHHLPHRTPGEIVEYYYSWKKNRFVDFVVKRRARGYNTVGIFVGDKDAPPADANCTCDTKMSQYFDPTSGPMPPHVHAVASTSSMSAPTSTSLMGEAASTSSAGAAESTSSMGAVASTSSMGDAASTSSMKDAASTSSARAAAPSSLTGASNSRSLKRAAAPSSPSASSSSKSTVAARSSTTIDATVIYPDWSRDAEAFSSTDMDVPHWARGACASSSSRGTDLPHSSRGAPTSLLASSRGAHSGPVAHSSSKGVPKSPLSRITPTFPLPGNDPAPPFPRDAPAPSMPRDAPAPLLPRDAPVSPTSRGVPTSPSTEAASLPSNSQWWNAPSDSDVDTAKA